MVIHSGVCLRESGMGCGLEPHSSRETIAGFVACASADSELAVVALIDEGDDFAAALPIADAVIDFSYHTVTPNGYDLQISIVTRETRSLLRDVVKPQPPATH